MALIFLTEFFGTVHERRPQSGGRGFVQCGHFADKEGRGVLQMRTSALFGAKNFGFFKIYGVSARLRREEGLNHCGQRRSIFCDFVRMSFMDGPFSVFV